MSIFAPTPDVIAALSRHFHNTPAPPSLSAPIPFNPALHTPLLPSFVDIHAACIQQDHTIATFLAPITPAKRDRMLEWWYARSAEVASGERVILMLFEPRSPPAASSHADAEPGVQQAGGGAGGEMGGSELAGFVMLLTTPSSETGPFRATVNKLLVSPRHRRKGVARRLMTKLEEMALSSSRTLLFLDTETGSVAETMYSNFGYTPMGTIPDSFISPRDGSLVSATFFFKDLRVTPSIST